MKERVGDEKLIIIGVAVRGINDHIRFYSQRLCTAAINTSNTTRTQTGCTVNRYDSKNNAFNSIQTTMLIYSVRCHESV